jgi:hypothetical protein
MKTIGEFELIDHGAEHAQHFQGCGVAFTPYDNVATGVGNDPSEAFDDCLEMIAQQGNWDLEGMRERVLKEEAWYIGPSGGDEALLVLPGVCDDCKYYLRVPEACGDCELNYYVSLRWNEERREKK